MKTMQSLRSRWIILFALAPFAGGCSVDINAGASPSLAAKGTAFTAHAQTVRHSTAPTGMTARWTRTRATDGVQEPAVNSPVISNVDEHSTNITVAAPDSFKPFERVDLTWRVTFNSWGQQSSRSKTETIRINPEMRLIISPDQVTAGQSATGRVELPDPAPRALSVELEINDQPREAIVTLSTNILTIPQGATQSETFSIVTEDNPSDSSGGASIGPGGGSPLRCQITATIADPTGASQFTYEKAENLRVNRP